MARSRHRGLLALGLAALAAAGAVGAFAASAPAERWVADPDDQYLLDVSIRQLRLGDGVRAYPTPEGSCVLLGDFLRTLNVPVSIDLDSGVASGWVFSEKNKLVIDRKALRVTYGGRSEALTESALRDVPEGWCADSQALARWFGIKLDARLNGAALLLESEAKLPVELAIERKKRAAQLQHKASLDLSALPQVRLPYRMWRAPALDFVVSGGVTYRASTGTKVDRRAAVYAAGEVARLSYQAQMTTDDRGRPQSVRLRAFRSDPDGELLGPLKATHFEFGDVTGFGSRLLGSSTYGRGAMVTNQPLATPTNFDRTRFEGDLPEGWEAELYRNDQLLAFADSGSDGRYMFEDVQLLYGENRIDIVLYGPQGQIRTRSEVVNVGQDNVPPGKFWYWAGVNQPRRNLLDFNKKNDDPDRPKVEATAAVAYGVDERTSVGLTVRAAELEDERLTYVEGTVRRSIGNALIEVAAARASDGGLAARAQLLGKFGNLNVTAEAIEARDFRINSIREKRYREARLAVDVPLKVGRTLIPVHGAVSYRDRGQSGSQLEAATRLSSHINRFNLAGELRYRKNWSPGGGPDPPDEIEGSLLASGRIGAVRLRGSGTWDIAPAGRFKNAELSAYWAASDKADFEAAVAYDAEAHLARARLTHIRRFDTLALALTAEAASDGSVAAGFNLNFSLDPSRGLHLSRRPLASAGAVRATVYRDLNDNGRRDRNEPAEKDALVTTGTRLAERGTDSHGEVLIAGLAGYVPIAVGVDSSSLTDPMWVPKKALQVVTPRPGVAAEVEIGLVGAGDIEGSVMREGGGGFEGLTLELVDASGAVAASTTSDFDGFFLFERVAYGRYTVRVSAESARIARIDRSLGLAAEVSPDEPVARLGTAQVRAKATIASAAPEKSSGTTPPQSLLQGVSSLQ